MGRNLAELRARARNRRGIADAPALDGERYTAWTFGDLAEVMEIPRGGQTLIGHPAVRDCGAFVTLEVSESPDSARALHRAGVRRLLAIAFRERIREIEKAAAKDVVLAPLQGDLVTAALSAFLSESRDDAGHFTRRVHDRRSRQTSSRRSCSGSQQRCSPSSSRS
jgi:hypothetical protein